MATRNETNKNFRSNFIFFKHGFLVKGQNTTKNICSLEEAVVGNVISYFRTLLKGLREFSFLRGGTSGPRSLKGFGEFSFSRFQRKTVSCWWYPVGARSISVDLYFTDRTPPLSYYYDWVSLFRIVCSLVSVLGSTLGSAIGFNIGVQHWFRHWIQRIGFSIGFKSSALYFSIVFHTDLGIGLSSTLDSSIEFSIGFNIRFSIWIQHWVQHCIQHWFQHWVQHWIPH